MAVGLELLGHNEEPGHIEELENTVEAGQPEGVGKCYRAQNDEVRYQSFLSRYQVFRKFPPVVHILLPIIL